jgi:hypothetical protein
MMPNVYNASRATPATDLDAFLQSTPGKQATKTLGRLTCKSGTVVILNSITHQVTILNARCRTWKCPTCGPILRNIWTNRIADAKPQRFITLTCDPSRWPRPDLAYEAMKEALPKLVSKLRKLVGTFEYCAIWELHESGYPHLHIAQRGKYMPKKLISDLWNELAIGYIVDIAAITDRRGAAAYVAKYITKTVEKAKSTLALTKVIQYSKHFFPPAMLLKKPRLDDHTVACYTRCPPYTVMMDLLTRYHYHVTQAEPFRGVVLDVNPGARFLADIDHLVIDVPP